MSNNRSVLANLKTATSLKLVKPTLPEIKILAKALENGGTPNLQMLDLSDCNLAGDLGTTIISAIAKAKSLQEVNLARTHLDNNLASQLFTAISKNGQIHTLNIAGNKFNGKVIDELIKLMHQPLPDQKSFGSGVIKSLNISNNDLDDNAVDNILAACKTGGLNTLDISAIKISHNYAFGQLVEQNQSLHTLNLSNCHLTVEQIAILCGTLENNKSLSSLNLSENIVAVTGGHLEAANHLATMLAHNQSLRVLNVASNKLTTIDVATILTPLVAANTSLTTLVLRDNKLTTFPKGEEDTLKTVLEENPTLQSLDLSGNPDLDLHSLTTMKKGSSGALKSLNIEGCKPVDATAQQALAEGVGVWLLNNKITKTGESYVTTVMSKEREDEQAVDVEVTAEFYPEEFRELLKQMPKGEIATRIAKVKEACTVVVSKGWEKAGQEVQEVLNSSGNQTLAAIMLQIDPDLAKSSHATEGIPWLQGLLRYISYTPEPEHSGGAYTPSDVGSLNGDAAEVHLAGADGGGTLPPYTTISQQLHDASNPI